MGRILSNTRVTSDNVRHYIEQATKEYSTFLSSAPTFCTYFSKNHLKSTYDRGLENINEVVGADSPVVFDRVDNLPVYKVENASFGTEITDFGISGSVASSAIILPDTVVPSVDDVFEIDYQTGRKVFLVTDVEQDNYNNSKFYKISFKLSSFNIEDVEAQTEGDFTVDYNLIGKTDSPIVRRTDFELYLAVEDVYDELLVRYTDEFYSKELGSFADATGPNRAQPVVDVCLNRFIWKNHLNEGFRSYRSFSYLDESVFSKIRPSDYRRTIYFFLESSLRDPKAIRATVTDLDYALAPVSASRYSRNWFAKNNFGALVPSSTLQSPPPSSVSPIRPEVISSIEQNSTAGLGPLEALIVRFGNSHYGGSNYPEILEHLSPLSDSESDYHLVPIALFILKWYHREISGRPSRI